MNATNSWFGSTAAVMSAIAALPTRGVMPGMPAMRPLAIEPDTSSASSVRARVGSIALNAR